MGERIVQSVSLYDYLICSFLVSSYYTFPSRFITNTLPIGNLVIALTILTQCTARLHLSFISNPDFPYIASSVLLSINT